MFKKYGPLIILLLLSIAMSIASPFFLAKDNLITIGIQTAVIGVLTIGELLVIITGGIDLAIGSTLALSMVISATMMKAGIPIGLCVVAALLLGAVFGYINGFVVTTMKIPAFIATLGMSGILRGAALMITDGLPISSLPDKVAWFGNGRVFSIPVPVLV